MITFPATNVNRSALINDGNYGEVLRHNLTLSTVNSIRTSDIPSSDTRNYLDLPARRIFHDESINDTRNYLDLPVRRIFHDEPINLSTRQFFNYGNCIESPYDNNCLPTQTSSNIARCVKLEIPLPGCESKSEISTLGPSSDGNNYHTEQFNTEISIKHFKIENSISPLVPKGSFYTGLRKRKSTKMPVKDDNYIENPSSEAMLKSDQYKKWNIKRIKKSYSKGKSSFPTVPLDLCKDLLSKIPNGDREKFKKNAKDIEELFKKIWKINDTGYNPRRIRRNGESKKITMTRVCDSGPSNILEISLTVDELFSDILSRLNINQRDISLPQGELSDKITKALEVKFEDIFDMNKFRFIHESVMAKRRTREFWEYVNKRNTRLIQLNIIYHFGKCIINQSREYLQEYKFENISKLKSIFLEKFEELFFEQKYFIITKIFYYKSSTTFWDVGT